MPSKKQYDLVTEDCGDALIPLHSEEAFKAGINFHVKYIGTQEVPRPSSRVEIVAAMRRVRYEFKARLMKKKNVELTVSIEGVKVTLDTKRTKSQAMRIVRTIGQAFEVCHRISLLASQRQDAETAAETVDRISVTSSCSATHKGDVDVNVTKSDTCSQQQSSPQKSVSCSPQKKDEDNFHHFSVSCDRYSFPNSVGNQSNYSMSQVSSPQSEPLLTDINLSASEYDFLPLSSRHQWQLMKQQLDQHEQQARSALAQVQLLTSQLASETTARMEAQTRVQQLLRQNRNLLEHINSLVGQLQQLETKLLTIPQQFSFDTATQQLVLDSKSASEFSPLSQLSNLFPNNASPASQQASNVTAGLDINGDNKILSLVTNSNSAMPLSQSKAASVTATGPELQAGDTGSIMTTVSRIQQKHQQPTNSPCRQALSLSLKNNWSSQFKAADTSVRTAPNGEISNNQAPFGDNTTSSDLGSSDRSSFSYSPGERLDQFPITPSSLSDSFLSPPSNNIDIPKIEPPPKSRRAKSNRLSANDGLTLSPNSGHNCSCNSYSCSHSSSSSQYNNKFLLSESLQDAPIDLADILTDTVLPECSDKRVEDMKQLVFNNHGHGVSGINGVNGVSGAGGVNGRLNNSRYHRLHKLSSLNEEISNA